MSRQMQPWVQAMQKALHGYFAYDEATGDFVRKVSRTGFAKAGDIAGWVDRKGYIQIKVNGKSYLAHRLAWLYVYGSWPQYDLDHINGDKSDNRIANLREAPGKINPRNKGQYKNNTSGHTGVFWHKQSSIWMAKIGGVYLGCFKEYDDAVSAVESHRARLGFTHRHGRSTEVWS